MHANDWQQTQNPKKLFSPKLQCFKQIYSAVEHTLRTAKLLLSTSSTSHSFLSEADIDTIPALQGVPKTLWAQGKCDFGLIKVSDSVVITHKSDYISCKQQYHLKQEATDEIAPILESLNATGVIVPCDDSLVCASIFPVKRIRNKCQPEWKFSTGFESS